MQRLRAFQLVTLLAGMLAASTARAQGSMPAAVPLPLPGSETDVALRLGQLLGARSADGYLLRGLGTEIGALTAALAAGRDTIVALAGEATYAYHSAHPWGGNDGLWRAGRGSNLLVSTGFAVRAGKVSFVVVPQLATEENQYIQALPWPQPNPPDRPVWANPFYPLPTGLDMPQRFGDRPRQALSVQGRVAVDVNPVLRAGLAQESRWWGPAVRNGTMLTSNAPPFAHVFAENPQPIVTRAGTFGYQVLLGALQESEFFDYDASNDWRTLSAAAVTWRWRDSLAAWPTVGVARAVMTTGRPGAQDLLNFFADAGRPWSKPADSTRQRDQIFMVFSRWLVPGRTPGSGAEAYVEWARYEQPASLRDFMEFPGHMQGYTFGVAWAGPYRSATLHLQAEASNMEPSPSVRVRPIGTSYTSVSIPQGWTNEGQMLGPMIGPSGSSKWVALDGYFERWRVGGSLLHMRRDANYRQTHHDPPTREDVSLVATLRGGVRIGPMEAMLEYSHGVRLNYLFQAYPVPGSPSGESSGVDLVNRSVTLTLTPRLGAWRGLR